MLGREYWRESGHRITLRKCTSRRIPYTESCLPCLLTAKSRCRCRWITRSPMGCGGQPPQRGARVIAPFRNEKLIGVVTAVDAKPPVGCGGAVSGGGAGRGAAAERSVAGAGGVDAEYYLAPLGEVLRGMLPLMAEVRRTVYYRITDLGRDVLAKAMEGDAGQGGRTNAGPSTRSPAAADELAQDGSLLKSANDRPLQKSDNRRSGAASSRGKSRTWSGGCWSGWRRARR